ncbi:MAG: hypothetical protein QY322_02035 [bacterium]|nr:MAG: hypothetical protein QY322_02035 [bacterium]
MSIREAIREVRKKNKESGRRRGKESENKVGDALGILAANGYITTSWDASGTEDKFEGIDKHIQLPDGTIIDLQVKSSRSGVDIARQNYPHIPAIEVDYNEKIDHLAMRLLGLIRAKVEGRF